MDDTNSFWQRLNSLIKQKNTTQNAISVQCGFNPRRLQNLSAGSRLPDCREAVKIAQALNTTVEYLVTGQDSNPAEIELRELKAKLKNFYTSL